MINYKDKINIEYNDETKLKENEIAFAIYYNAYNKVIYIKSKEISNENINVDNFRKMFAFKEINKTIPSTGDSINNITDYIIYGCYERKFMFYSTCYIWIKSKKKSTTYRENDSS